MNELDRVIQRVDARYERYCSRLPWYKYLFLYHTINEAYVAGYLAGTEHVLEQSLEKLNDLSRLTSRPS